MTPRSSMVSYPFFCFCNLHKLITGSSRHSQMRGRGEPAVVLWQASLSSPTSHSSYSSLFSPIDSSPVRAYTSPTIDNFEFNHPLIATFDTLCPFRSSLVYCSKFKLLEAPVIVLLCLFPTMNSTGRTLMAQFRIQLSTLILFPFTPPHVHQLAFSHLNALITNIQYPLLVSNDPSTPVASSANSFLPFSL